MVIILSITYSIKFSRAIPKYGLKRHLELTINLLSSAAAGMSKGQPRPQGFSLKR